MRNHFLSTVLEFKNNQPHLFPQDNMEISFGITNQDPQHKDLIKFTVVKRLFLRSKNDLKYKNGEENAKITKTHTSQLSYTFPPSKPNKKLVSSTQSVSLASPSTNGQISRIIWHQLKQMKTLCHSKKNKRGNL